ncbi:MAG TPA: cytochrome C biogenesis protein, partial [Pseudobdellovibrionaceae bacterium]|nr:cytochrome C biogenesis protein [Pseudobdellovibrionaceae bacterium]
MNKFLSLALKWTKAFLVLFLIFQSVVAFGSPGDRLKYLPIQDSGRVKPFDSFSKEMLKLVYGKAEYQGRPAHEVVLTFFLTPEVWGDKPIFELRNFQILEILGLDIHQRYFKGADLFLNEKLLTLMQDLQAKRDSKEKLTPFFQALQRLESQYYVFQQLSMGKLLRFLPPTEGTQWLSMDQMEGSEKVAFEALAKAFAQYIGTLNNTGAEAKK